MFVMEWLSKQKFIEQRTVGGWNLGELIVAEQVYNAIRADALRASCTAKKTESASNSGGIAGGQGTANISRDAIAAVDRYMSEECVAMSTKWSYMQELRVWLQQHPC